MADWVRWAGTALGLRVGRFHAYAPRALVLPPGHDDARWPSPRPRISIVTPVRNQVRFIDAAIESVLAQGCPDLQYIVMDGASTDGTAERIARHAPRLAHAESAADRGQADAIGKGFARSDGEVMGWLNGDDLLLPGALAQVAAYFARHPEVDVVYGDRIVVDEEGRDVGRWVLADGAEDLLGYVDFIPQETLFWRRAIWEKAGGRIDTALRFAMDWELLSRLRAAGARFAHIPRFLGGFRVHAAQKTSAEIGAVGFAEMDEVRRRCLGRVPGRTEVALRAAPWIARQLAVDLKDRFARRPRPVK